MLPRIFIGGTGRSGTSIVYEALGHHQAIYSFPRETRFLIDPDGLMDLVDALSTRYSYIQGREALYRFERLMRVYLAVPERAPFRGFDLPAWIGEDYYWCRLDQFYSSLRELEFSGTAWQVETEAEGRLVEWARQAQGLYRRLQGKPAVPFKLTLPRKKLALAKYFKDRQDLVALAAGFVEDLFLHAAQQHRKQTWCEKTPQNIYHVDFLWELFPESVVIHVKRDPRGVVHSMAKESWVRAPQDMRDTSLFLRTMYDRWFDVKETIDSSKHRYLEVKIEEVAASPRMELEKIATFCGIAGRFPSLPNITSARVNYWQQTMTSQERRVVNQLLGPYIERMGYEI